MWVVLNHIEFSAECWNIHHEIDISEGLFKQLMQIASYC